MAERLTEEQVDARLDELTGAIAELEAERSELFNAKIGFVVDRCLADVVAQIEASDG